MVESDLGPLLVAVTDRGLARLSFDAEPEAQLEELARLAGPRVLRAPRALDATRRELDDYFSGRRTVFDLELDLTGLPEFTVRVLDELARVPYGRTATYRELAERAGNPRAARAVGMVMNRNRIPIVLPCHRIVGSTGEPRRLRRRARAEGEAPASRGRDPLASSPGGIRRKPNPAA